MPVRAVRGAVQLERDHKQHLAHSVTALFTRMLTANGLDHDDLISVLFTATADLRCAFPAAAVRALGLDDIPLMCAQELDIDDGLPRVVRILLHTETPLSRRDIQHIYHGGAAALRRDLATAGGTG